MVQHAYQHPEVELSCRPEGEAGDDFGNSKSIQEGLFATLFTLTKNRAMDTSLRIAGLRVVLEFMQVCCAMLWYPVLVLSCM